MAKDDAPLCIQHDCPAAPSCGRYAAFHIANPKTRYFKPPFDHRKARPCQFHCEPMERRIK